MQSYFFPHLDVPPTHRALGNCLRRLYHEPPLGPQAEAPREHKSLPSRLCLICAIYPLGDEGFIVFSLRVSDKS